MVEVKKFFERNEIFIFDVPLQPQFEDHLNIKQGVQFQNTHYNPIFIE